MCKGPSSRRRAGHAAHAPATIAALLSRETSYTSPPGLVCLCASQLTQTYSQIHVHMAHDKSFDARTSFPLLPSLRAVSVWQSFHSNPSYILTTRFTLYGLRSHRVLLRAARPRAFQVSAQSCRGRRRCRVGQVLQPGAPSKRNAFLSAMHALEHVPQTESVRAASASSSSSPSKTEQPSAKLARRRQPRNESSVLSGCT